MTSVDVKGVSELVRSTGEGLKEAFARVEPLSDREKLFEAFAAVDGPAVERLRSGLARQHPAVGWLEGEFDSEFQRGPPPGEYWVCDAIDGAVQFLQAIPAWGLSLALIRDGVPVFALVHDFIHGEQFHAIAGGGAYLNGRRMQASRKQHLGDALVAMSHPPFVAKDAVNTKRVGVATSAVLPHVFALRNLGPTSLQLAYVAAGRLDAFWEFGEDLYNWLAGALLIREAGGFVTDARGGAFGWNTASLLAAAPALHSPLKAVLERVE